ncbi:MAG: type II secretion system protein [Planctomycetota bacterium]
MNAAHVTRPSGRAAFTLIELLVTIAVLAVLIAITLPVLGRARDAAKETQCLSNTRQILTAINAFTASNQSRLPENRILVSDNEYITWRRLLANTGALPVQDVWQCPLHQDTGPRGEAGYVEDGARCVGDIASSYALNGHVLWRYQKTDNRAQALDTAIQRPSHTILLAETNRAFSHLRVSPPNVANYYGDSPGPYSYWHNGKGVYGFQDGHVEILGFLETGGPDCRWHNGRDLTDDPFVPQKPGEFRPHDHPDWQYLVPEIYLGSG